MIQVFITIKFLYSKNYSLYLRCILVRTRETITLNICMSVCYQTTSNIQYISISYTCSKASSTEIQRIQQNTQLSLTTTRSFIPYNKSIQEALHSQDKKEKYIQIRRNIHSKSTVYIRPKTTGEYFSIERGERQGGLISNSDKCGLNMNGENEPLTFRRRPNSVLRMSRKLGQMLQHLRKA